MGSRSRNPLHLVSRAANQYKMVAPRSTRIPRPIGPGRTSCRLLGLVVCIVSPLYLLLGPALGHPKDVGAGQWGHGLEVEAVQLDDLEPGGGDGGHGVPVGVAA